MACEQLKEADEKRLSALFWLAIGLATLQAAYAVIVARDLADDGSFYLLSVAAHGTFRLFEPARVIVHILQQGLAVAAAHAGVENLFTLGQFLSLGCSGWPIVLTAVCWPVLPRRKKAWIVGPMLNLIAVVPATNFIGIGEGTIASCLLWLAFFLVRFRMGEPLGAAAGIAVTAACGFSHEAAFPFLAGLSVFAGIGAFRRVGRERAGLIVVSIVAALGALHLFTWILLPRSLIERSDFFVSLLGGFLASRREINLPALLTLAAFAAIALAVKQIRAGKSADSAVWIVGIVFMLFLALLVLMPDSILAPNRFFAARGLPIIFTTLAAIWMVLTRYPDTSLKRLVSPQVARILFGLVLTQIGGEIVMTARWNATIADVRELAASHSGVIAFADSSRLLNPHDLIFRRDILESWSVEPLSIILAPNGRVQALLEPSPNAGWVPYHPDSPRTLPQAPGLDWSGFPRSMPLQPGKPGGRS